MITKVIGSTISGFFPRLVNVEVGAGRGLSKFEMVGLGQSAVKEGKDRIMAAIKNSGFLMERQKIIVNLAPASIKKDGCSLDLPISIGLLASNGMLDPNFIPSKTVMVGELSLDGSVKPVRGVFAMVQELKNLGMKEFILPLDNTQECHRIKDVKILPAESLNQVIDCLSEKIPWPEPKVCEASSNEVEEMDWSDVKGQPLAKRAMEIAAAGGHHILLAGTPGVGKTLLAKRFHTILPDLTAEQECEVRKIQSIDGEEQHLGCRPFRMPHHHATLAGMIGGGNKFRMGEFSLAHFGILFMDEFPEFRKDIVEALREPLEEGVVRVSRAEGAFSCPARFQLIAAMNLCPCGNLGDEKKACECTPWSIQKYRNKLSRPIRDRMDLFVEFKNTDWKILWDERKEETSSQVQQRVLAARDKQQQRFDNETVTNGNVSARKLLRQVKLDDKTQEMVEKFIKKDGISLRSMTKIIRVSRTIADLDSKVDVAFEHVCEALQYRFHLPY